MMRASRNRTAVSDEPATLDRVIQEAISGGLRERYEVQRDIPHDLLVILMQMNQHKQNQHKQEAG